MSSLTLNIVMPLLGVLVGALSALFGSYLQHSWTTKREAISRSENRNAELKLRQIEFQHDTLIELQDTVAKLTRATGKAFHQDTVNFSKIGVWQKELLGDDVSTEHNLLSTRCTVLASRLQDGVIREQTQKFVDGCHKILSCANESAAQTLILAMTEQMKVVHDSIGKSVRNLHQASVTRQSLPA